MLTKKQAALLKFIGRYIEGKGYCPSFDEMAKGIGLKSKSGVFRLVDGLEERGFIRRFKERARAIEIIRKLQ